MAGINIQLPVLFSQLPHLQHIVQNEESHPEMYQGLAQDAAVESEKFEREHVQKTEKQEGAQAVSTDAGSGGGAQAESRRRRKKDEDKEMEEETLQSTPWSGNIVNVKV